MSLLKELHESYSSSTKYKPSDVQSKLASIGRETFNNKNTDTTCFGLEDSHGQTIKVFVPDEQAKDFEASLSQRLSDLDPSDPGSPEIAEVLFSMRDQFDIADVEWPKFVEDEEEETPDVGNEKPEGSELENPEEDPMAADGEQSTGEEPSMNMGGGEDQKSELVNSVIQAMMADAEARRQEHLAKAAEARAKEAEAAASMAEQKLKSEEEVADMEAYYDTQSLEKKEAKKLAKLAKYRHSIKQQDMEQGKFNDYGDAMDDQEQQGAERMDQPSGENPDGADPAEADDGQYDTDNIDDELDGTGFENEEQETTDQEMISKLNDIDTTLKYLQSLRVQKQAYNG